MKKVKRAKISHADLFQESICNSKPGPLYYKTYSQATKHTKQQYNWKALGAPVCVMVWLNPDSNRLVQVSLLLTSDLYKSKETSSLSNDFMFFQRVVKSLFSDSLFPITRAGSPISFMSLQSPLLVSGGTVTGCNRHPEFLCTYMNLAHKRLKSKELPRLIVVKKRATVSESKW